MITPVALIPVLDQIRQWADLLFKRTEYLNDSRTDAINALYRSLSETQIYLGRRQRRFSLSNRTGSTPTATTVEAWRDEEMENELSRLWTAAAFKLHDINPEVSEMCLRKSDYWASPEEWNEQALTEAKIKIEDVIKSLRNL